MTRLFGFVQLDLPGAIAVADGRYVLRDDRGERVLVIETLGAPLPSRRRRRKPKETGDEGTPGELSLARVTLVRAFEEFEDERGARAWLDSTVGDEEALDAVLDEAIVDLNRALHTQAVAGGDPRPQVVAAERAAGVRVGYGGGKDLADSLFTFALAVDPTRGTASRRRARSEELRPQQRLAAVLGGREGLDACETLLLRARADLDSGRTREAALQVRVGLEALLAELEGSLDNPGHREDMATLRARRDTVIGLADSALTNDLGDEQLETLGGLLAIGERILRRRRVLGE